MKPQQQYDSLSQKLSVSGLRHAHWSGILLPIYADVRYIYCHSLCTCGDLRLMCDGEQTSTATCLQVLSQLSATGLNAPGLPDTMYLTGQDSQDIRVQQLQCLGVPWVEVSRGAQLQQGQQHQLAAPRQAAEHVQKQQQQQHQPQLNLQESSTADEARSTGKASQVAPALSSVQQAVLTINMILWRLCPHRQHFHTGVKCNVPSRSEGTCYSHLHPGAPEHYAVGLAVPTAAAGCILQPHTPQPTAECPGWACASCCCNQHNIAEASQLLDSYLQAGEQAIQQSLQKWVELSALVSAM